MGHSVNTVIFRLQLPAPYLNQTHFWILSYLDYRTGLWSRQNHGSIKPGLKIHLFQLPGVQKQRLFMTGWRSWIHTRTKQLIMRKKRMKGTFTIQPFLQLSSLALPQWTCIVDCQQFISGNRWLLVYSTSPHVRGAYVRPSSQCHLFSLHQSDMFKIQKIQEPQAEETSATLMITRIVFISIVYYYIIYA